MSEILCAGHISPTTHSALKALPGIDWTQLWQLIQQYGPRVEALLKILLPLLGSGGLNAAQLLQTIEAILQMFSTTTPTPPTP